MTDRIKALYEAAGVDLDSLEHKVRERWNKSSARRRREYIDAQEESRAFQFSRWDQLPKYVQNGVMRAIRAKQGDKND